MIHKAYCKCFKCLYIEETKKWKVAHRYGDVQVATSKDLRPGEARELLRCLGLAIRMAEEWRSDQLEGLLPVVDSKTSTSCTGTCNT